MHVAPNPESRLPIAVEIVVLVGGRSVTVLTFQFMKVTTAEFLRKTTHWAVTSALAITTFMLPARAKAEESPSLPNMMQAASVPSGSSFDVLVGRWIRPDGGYTVTIKSVDTDGKIDGGYANPSPLPFFKAEAFMDGKTIKVFLKITAGGYNGSAYTLAYDPEKDILKGVYYQAVAKQKFDIFFERENR